MQHKDIINLWARPKDLAAQTGQKYYTVMQWRHRNSIPSEHWEAVVKAAQNEDLPVTYKLLAENQPIRD